MLALPVEGVVGIRDDLGVEGFHLLHQTMADRFQERLDGSDNLLPGLSRLAARAFRNR